MWDDGASRRYYDFELATRVGRAAGKERDDQIEWFVSTCRDRKISSVIEVGAGGGRDGLLLQQAGLIYTGVDLSEVGATLCREQGLNTSVASAIDLPFDDDTFDAGWSMSTLMHLPGDEINKAIDEFQRVLRPGGLLAVGLWGSTPPITRIDEHERLFQQRSDEQVRSLLGVIGRLIAFETWGWFDNGSHYQWAAIEIG